MIAEEPSETRPKDRPAGRHLALVRDRISPIGRGQTDTVATPCDQALVETLSEWGIEPWEIALATGRSEASVTSALGRVSPSAERRERAPWADDFLIFLHARLTDLPGWWEPGGPAPSSTAL